MALPALKVELFIDNAWVDVTTYVIGKPMVRIHRGEVDEQTRMQTARCEFSLRNDKVGAVGIWNNRNPDSIYFGKLGRNIRCRVTRGADIRFVGAVRNLPQRWTRGGRTAVVPIFATGLLGQLSQGAKELRSPVFRDVMGLHNDTYRLAYWPMEEGALADQLASATNGDPLVIIGGSSIDFGSYDSPGRGSDPLPTLASGSTITAFVPPYASLQHKIVTIWAIPAAPASTIALATFYGTGGTIARWDLYCNTNGSLSIAAVDATGNVFDQTAFVAFDIDALEHFLTSFELTQNGANVDLTLLVQHIHATSPNTASMWNETFTGCTIGRIHQVVIAPTGALADWSVGHLALASDIDNGLSGLADATMAHYGETTLSRIDRLPEEEQITLNFPTNTIFSLGPAMGPQGTDTLVALFDQAVTVDQGILHEERDDYALRYLPGYKLYNQIPVVTLDHDAGHLGEDMPDVDDDDFLLHNDVTARRPSGSFARSYTESGPLSIEEPPEGVGSYDRGPVTAHVQTDGQLIHVAGWINNIRTPEDLRFRKVAVNLARDVFEDDTALRQQVIDLDIGQVMALTNLPAEFTAPETQYAMVRGYNEAHDKNLWNINFYTAPYWPWEVEPVESGGSIIPIGYAAGATSIKLATSDGPQWDETYEPYYIQANNEAMKVTAMTSTAATFVAVGTVSHANNANVTPGMPVGVAAGDALFMVAAIRSTTGTVTTPTGWTLLSPATFTNFRLYGRYYDTGVLAPTVSFTGGAAGDDTSAQIMAARNVSLYLDGGKYTVAPYAMRTSDNSSAQNILFPALTTRHDGCMTLWVGWKQDDWTSVGGLFGGTTEISEPSTTTGNDQGFVWNYEIQTTAEDYEAGSWTVTGGAAAISRSMVGAFRPLQTATVVREQNGVNVALDAGDEVKTWRLGVSAL